MFQSQKTEKGFTLVEILLVIIILAILALVGLQQFAGVTERAADTVDEANIRLLQSSARIAVFSNGGNPGETVIWTDNEAAGDQVYGEAGDSQPAGEDWAPGSYIDTWPEVPTAASTDWTNYQVTINSDGSIEVTDQD